MKNKALKREHDVMAIVPGEFVTIPKMGVFEKIKVVGKITRNRLLLLYELGFIDNAILNIKRATPSTMIHSIEVLETELARLKKTIERVLVELGDTDPRH